MRARLKHQPHVTGHASRFNTHGVGEVIFYFDETDGHGGCDSEYCREIQVYVTRIGSWMDLDQAFRSGMPGCPRYVITDSLNTEFFEPRTREERERGFA